MTHRLLPLILTATMGALAVFFSIGVRYGEPPWMQELKLVILGLVLATVFVAGLVLIHSKLLPASGLLVKALRTIAIASMVTMPVLMLVRLTDMHFQKLTLLIEFGMVHFLLLINGIDLPKRVATGICAAVLVASLLSGFSGPARKSFIALFVEDNNKADSFAGLIDYNFSPLLDIKVTTQEIISDAGSRGVNQGGAIEALDGTRALLVDGNGLFYVLTQNDNRVATDRLPKLESLMNRTAYERDVESPSNSFRVTDLLLLKEGDEGQVIYLSHHQWDEVNHCITLDVDEATIDPEALDQPLEWRNRFKSTPCIPGSAGFSNETGGRLALLSPTSLLLTVGITLADRDTWPQDPEISYGKILKLDRTRWTSRVYSQGHRNPQGLFVDGKRIWSTEHGPNGGDELNLISEGADYGWPTSSYGVDYGKKILKTSATPGRHTTGVQPVYAWVPSIGVSRLFKVKGDGYRAWAGDLLVGSLSGRGNGKSIYRVRMDEGQVKTVERIYLGERVRDMVEMENGQILSWNGRDVIQLIEPANHVFADCNSCHALDSASAALNGIGPDLWRIVGQSVASVDGYEYSDAMKEVGGRWSKERLDWFLRDPEKAVPGTKMAIPGIDDSKRRQEIIEYLEGISGR